MKDFSWKYFSMTGDVDAYLLYKQVTDELAPEADMQEDEQGNEDSLEGFSG
ncbi:YqzL family protein [Paenibacillus athensensis]|uniref:YqzL family protein n=1 Tax=Paenibacillus athensensis TaxID=1967502 RepID=A0A4Y8PTY7_9BACL|nr:YqzL family protein [Paenibacillus athensensis]MCD1261566.1 YqzL family protein [Paenibacillus athensensis]